jgi:B-box zinc finger
MNRSSKSAKNPDRKYTSQEKSLLSRYGYCKKTAKLLKLYCSNCDEIICESCMIDDHNGHLLKLNDTSLPMDVITNLKKKVEKLHHVRIEDLNKKISSLDTNLAEIGRMSDLKLYYKKLADHFEEKSNKITKNPISIIEKWVIDSKDIETLRRGEIRERINSEMKDYDDLQEITRNMKEFAPNVKSCVYQYYITKKNKQKSHDDLFEVNEVPKECESLLEYYIKILEDVMLLILDCMAKTLNVFNPEMNRDPIESLYIKVQELLNRGLKHFTSEFRNLNHYGIQEKIFVVEDELKFGTSLENNIKSKVDEEIEEDSKEDD